MKGKSKTTELRIYEGETNTQLPFSVKLESFSVVSHPDSDLPADYVCVIEVDDGKARETAEVSVNRVYRKDGYKFVLKGHDMFYTGASFIDLCLAAQLDRCCPLRCFMITEVCACEPY